MNCVTVGDVNLLNVTISNSNLNLRNNNDLNDLSVDLENALSNNLNGDRIVTVVKDVLKP